MNFYTVVLNTKALKKNATDSTNGQLAFTKYTGVNASSFQNAPICIRAPYDTKSTARALISFENSGSNAAALWLSLSGDLKIIDNNGKVKKILTEDSNID